MADKNSTALHAIGVRTMSTREIADLTGKRHDNVMADAKAMLEELGLNAPDFSGSFQTAQGNTYECLNLPKRESLILVSGYSISMRARISDLKVKCVTLKELHDAVADERDALRVKVYDLERAAVKRREISDGVEAELVDECDTLRTLKIRAEAERDELRAKYDELLVALHGIGAALGIPEGDRSPYSVTCGTLERVNRLAEIEAQEPVALVETSGDQGAGIGWSGAAQPVGAKLYARPVPAQAVPDADGARFRWLCEDHSDRETRERCRSLIDRLPVMSYSDAVMSIDAAMAAAPEHKA